MRTFLYISILLVSISPKIFAQKEAEKDSLSTDKIQAYIQSVNQNNLPSNSKGTPGNGSLTNGKLMPFLGENFHYFDTSSYLAGRAFVHEKVREAVLKTYQEMRYKAPGRIFCLMECSHEHGGKMSPHRTHQNGLSIDFMVPLLRNGLPFYELDYIGAQHYWLDFNDKGEYTEDTSIKIDFDLLALHILILNEEAKKVGLKIDKVILKMELKDQFYATKSGKEVKSAGIYITKSLSPLINSLHDDHFHVDFSIL